MKVILLGAGASRGCFETPIAPVASEFGKVLRSTPDWPDAYRSLESVVTHLGLDPETWSLEPVWSCIDYYAKLQPALPLAVPWLKGASREIKKAILSIYGHRCDNASVATDSTLATLLAGLAPGDAVMSFNYDTIAERLAKKLGVRLICPPMSTSGGAVRFAKPHGSVSWTIDFKTRRVEWRQGDGAPLLNELCNHHVDCNREPLVLGAVPIKSELIQQVQAHFDLVEIFHVVAMQWRALVEAIRDADVIVVAGYSFPQEDRYGRFMIEEGLRLRTSSVRVEVFDLDCTRPHQSRVVAEVFGTKLGKLVFGGPMKPRSA